MSIFNPIINNVNAGIKSSYPTTMDLGNGLSFTTGLIRNPNIYGTYLNFPLDGSIFKTATGYVNPGYSSMNLVNTSATATDMQVLVNNQVFNTLGNSLNINGFSFSTTALGFPATIQLLGQTTVQVANNSIVLTATPNITWGWFWGF